MEMAVSEEPKVLKWKQKYSMFRAGNRARRQPDEPL
jgi:hypothetical protein